MPCKHRDGMIICSRATFSKPCKYCGRPHEKLCDFPLTGDKAGKTCDFPMCRRCAYHVNPDSDYCRPHAEIIKKKETENAPTK